MPRGRRGGGNSRRGESKVSHEVAEQVDEALPKVHGRRGRRGRDDDTDGDGDNTPDSDDVEYTPGQDLPPSARRQMGGLEEFQDMSATDAILARGGNASAFNRIRSDYRTKSVGELAMLAAKGDQDAVTALKLIKQASKKAQKYRGK